MPTIIDRIAQAFGYIKTEQVSDPAAWLRAEAADHRWDYLDSGLTDEAHMRMYERLSWVQTAVGAVAQTAATTALEVVRLEGEKRRNIENHPFEMRLDRPNPLMSRYELMVATFVNQALTGNAYWWLNRSSKDAEPDELWVLPSQSVRPVPDERLYLKGYIYEAEGNVQIPLELHEVVHFRRYNPLNPFVGLSPMESLRMTTRGDLAQQQWNYNYFGRDNAKAPGALAFSAPIPDSEWERMKEDIRREHGGTKRNMMMLRGVGDKGVQWVSMAMSQRDMQFLEGRNFNKEEIYSIYAPGLASMLAVNATEANSIAGRKTFIELGVWPHLVAVAQKITNDVLPAYGNDLRAQFEDIRITDRAMELQEQQAFATVHTIDEVRQTYFDAEPLGDERGQLLVSEIGRGMTPTEQPQSMDMQSILTQLNRGAGESDAEPQPQTPADDSAPDQPQNDVAVAAQDDAMPDERKTTKRRDEEQTFRRWLKRNPNRTQRLDDFESDILTHADKAAIAAEWTEDGDAEDTPFPLTRGSITLDAVKRQIPLPLDWDDDEAERRLRMALEREIADELEQELRRWLRSVLPSASSVEIEQVLRRLQDGSTRFRDVLRRALQDSADLGVSVAVNQLDNIGYGFDYTLAHAQAAEWASRYSYELVSGIVENSRRRLQVAVSEWIENSQPLEQLIKELEPVFGRRRAETISATEITRAFAEGNRLAFEASGVVSKWAWQNSEDERVCPVCGPLGGKVVEMGQPFEMGIYAPPAHVNCRCWTRPIVEMPDE